ncbi:Man1-Src1p-C-terminal domain-containing protein [Armillaria luteobubalina]|uniref:Man1-Src1p-C-terminal domain-containing protein n=1 Tax=Armillaria luteobubalina TaxID=153913 RepID=A0AA39QHU6_9AGAR|nr:Man1-Src1p-C-terminal domain-containing protein [Armillaria luteobubalina]
MSTRLTTTQVIEQGRYLEPGFEASSLTVSQLIGVLLHHQVKFPTPYSKPKLVEIFNEEIKSKLSPLKRQRLKQESSIASDIGITDGVTGQPLTSGSESKSTAPARRSSRRLSRAPTQEVESSPPRPDPPKRRRSSAQPNLGGPSRKSTVPKAPTLVEESEPEEELPVRKVGRSKKASETAGASSRRVSQTEDSGWEDNNVFQSGAESSSPMRPSPVRPRTRRPLRQSRKSSSAPPQMVPLSPPPPAAGPSGLQRSPPQSRFEPQLPSIISVGSRLSVPRFLTPSPPHGEAESESKDELIEDAIPDDHESISEAVVAMADDADLEVNEETNAGENVPASAVLPLRGQDVVERLLVQAQRPAPRAPLSPGIRLLLLTFFVGYLAVIWNFKLQSVSFGYCDPGSDTNPLLEEARVNRTAIELCNRENRSLLHEDVEGDLTPCPLPFILPTFYPNSCTPCPWHATCTRDSVTCNTGFMLRSHPLAFYLSPVPSRTDINLSLTSPPNDLIWRLVHELVDGLPGVPTIALSPSCVEDPRRQRNIGTLGKYIDNVLAEKRGEILCADNATDVADVDGGNAKKWGMPLDSLRDLMLSLTPAHLIKNFDDLFTEAIQQLVEWGDVIISEDSSGDRYIAHITPKLSWVCTVRVKSRETWIAWRLTLYGLLTSGIIVLWFKRRRAMVEEEAKRVAELVDYALAKLKYTELGHHTDPITMPFPYVPSVRLRDEVMRLEPEWKKSMLWDQVEKVVESNANVRANIQEVYGGDEMRVWRWVGSQPFTDGQTPIRFDVGGQPADDGTGVR